MGAEEKFWTFALRLSALSLIGAAAFVALPNFGLTKFHIGLWFAISLICFVVAKSQTKWRSEDDDLHWYD